MKGPKSTSVDELRPVTALFADIVNSTALGEHLPPDEVKAVVGECVNRMTIAVERFGGVVTAFMGDGIAAFFGIPTAREDDAERAAEAALAIRHVAGLYTDEVRRAWGITDFDVRIGVNSGQAATGAMGGKQPVVSALGDVPNVAARLQTAAAPGEILAGEATAELLGKTYRLNGPKKLTVKGRAASVDAYSLMERIDHHEPDEARPLVGRRGEIEALRDALAAVGAGRGSVVLVVGEAGMGKSALLMQTSDAAPPNATLLRGHNLSYSGAVLYQPFVQALRGWLGVSATEPAIAVRAKLRTRIDALVPESDPVFAALSSMLGIDNQAQPSRAKGSRGSQEVKATDVEGAYVTFVKALADRGPVILVVDDFHWVDPATRTLTEALLALTDSHALLLILAMRPDARSDARSFRLKVLDEYAHRTTEIRMRPLGDDDIALLLQTIVGESIDEATLRDVVAFAEGNPLYAQELMRALRNSKPGEAARWTIARAKTLTPALQNLLVARLDRLPEEVRAVALTAAVLGRSFAAALLEKIVGKGAESEIRLLLREGIIRELTRYPDLQYEFTEGLMRDAALSTQTPARLKKLYSLAGKALEKQSGKSEENAELLAYYFYRSSDQARSLPYLQQAAERARKLGAEEAAVELLHRAEKLTAEAGATGEARTHAKRAKRSSR